MSSQNKSSIYSQYFLCLVSTNTKIKNPARHFWEAAIQAYRRFFVEKHLLSLRLEMRLMRVEHEMVSLQWFAGFTDVRGTERSGTNSFSLPDNPVPVSLKVTSFTSFTHCSHWRTDTYSFEINTRNTSFQTSCSGAEPNFGLFQAVWTQNQYCHFFFQTGRLN